MKEQIYLVTLKVALDYLSPEEAKNVKEYLLRKIDECKTVGMHKDSNIEELRENYSTYESLLKLV